MYLDVRASGLTWAQACKNTCKYILSDTYSDNLSAMYPGILSDILSDILSGLYSDILSGRCSDTFICLILFLYLWETLGICWGLLEFAWTFFWETFGMLLNNF